jgi:hypothetical protein
MGAQNVVKTVAAAALRREFTFDAVVVQGRVDALIKFTTTAFMPDVDAQVSLRPPMTSAHHSQEESGGRRRDLGRISRIGVLSPASEEIPIACRQFWRRRLKPIACRLW